MRSADAPMRRSDQCGISPPRILNERSGSSPWRSSSCLIRWRWCCCSPPAFTQGAKTLADPSPHGIDNLATGRNVGRTHGRRSIFTELTRRPKDQTNPASSFLTPYASMVLTLREPSAAITLMQPRVGRDYGRGKHLSPSIRCSAILPFARTSGRRSRPAHLHGEADPSDHRIDYDVGYSAIKEHFIVAVSMAAARSAKCAAVLLRGLGLGETRREIAPILPSSVSIPRLIGLLPCWFRSSAATNFAGAPATSQASVRSRHCR